MLEERLDRIESMLSQLINMVGLLSKGQNDTEDKLEKLSIKVDALDSNLHELSNKVDTTNATLHKIDEKAEIRYQQSAEILKKLELEQDILWDKASRNERELAFLKKGFRN